MCYYSRTYSYYSFCTEADLVLVDYGCELGQHAVAHSSHSDYRGAYGCAGMRYTNLEFR